MYTPAHLKDKVIFYSLGNFIFDQYFSTETMQGLTVGMTVVKADKPKLSFELFPVEISKQSQPALASEDVKKKIIAYWSAFPFTMDFGSNYEALVKNAVKILKGHNFLVKGDRAIVVSDVNPRRNVDTLEIIEVD